MVKTNDACFENYLLCTRTRGHVGIYLSMQIFCFAILVINSQFYYYYYYCLFLVSLRQSIWHTINSRRLTPNNNNAAANASSLGRYNIWTAIGRHITLVILFLSYKHVLCELYCYWIFSACPRIVCKKSRPARQYLRPIDWKNNNDATI